MGAVIRSLSLAIGQLSDRAVLRVLAKTFAITLAAVAVLGATLGFGLYRLLVSWGVTFSMELGAIAGVLLALVGGWLLFRIVALAVMQFFADDIVIAVEQCHYPECAASARKLPFGEDLANSLRGAARAMLFNLLALPVALVLFFTAIGPAVVFLAVNAVLLGRELTDMGWLRHRPTAGSPNPVNRVDRVLLGGAVAALMAVPFVNFLAPVIGAAAGTHLVQISYQKSPKA